MSFDFGQAAIDNEIAMMIKRVRDGFGFSKESASLEEIKETGPAGLFAANPATLERMHTSTFLPELADRKIREHWELEGSSTIHQRAMNKVFDILSVPNTAVFEPDVDARIRAEFEGLVAGDAMLQEGWKRLDIGRNVPVRERRPSRRRRKHKKTENSSP